MAKRAPRAKAAPTVAQFIAELLADVVQETVYSGLVKATDDADPKALMFAQMGDPTHWVRLSEDAITKIEKLPDVNVRGRRWRAAKLFLKPPVTPAEEALANLAELHQLNLAGAKASLAQAAFWAPVTTMAPVGGVCPDGYTQIFDDRGQPHCIKDQES